MDLFAWGSGGGRSWAWALPCALCACAAAGALVITAPLRMVGTSTFFALWLVPAALGALRRGPTAAGLCLAWPLLGLPLVSVAMSEIDASFRLVADQVQEGTPAGLPASEARALVGLHACGAAGLWLFGMPEAASAQWQRHVRGAPVRVTADDVAMRDPEVRRELHLLATQAAAPDAPAAFEPRAIRWPAWTDERRSLRAALALDCPATLHASLRRTPGAATLALTARCPPAEHPQASTWARVGHQDLKWDPALLAHLESRGDLQRYEAVWTWEVRVDDPRLLDTTTVPRGLGERLLLALHAWLMRG